MTSPTIASTSTELTLDAGRTPDVDPLLSLADDVDSADEHAPIPVRDFNELVSSCAVTEKRTCSRREFSNTIVLAAIDLEHNEIVGSPTLVDGRDISETGISFLHETPLDSTHLLAGLRDQNGSVQSVALTVIWSRQREDGRYHTGGCFDRRLPIGESVFARSNAIDESA